MKSAALFKNGLGFLTYEVVLPQGATTVHVADLPVPAHGTFWVTYEDGVDVGAIVAGTEDVASPVAVTDLRELLRANVGRRVKLWTSWGGASETLEGTLLELESPEPMVSPGPYTMDGATMAFRSMPAPSLPAVPSVVVVETASKVVAMRVDAVQRVDFEDDTIVDTLSRTRSAAFLRVERPQANATTKIMVTSLVKGLTWVPSYAIDISDAKIARLQAKAVVVDEAVELDGVRLDLVTGYPHAVFGDVRSPLAQKENLSDFLASLARRGSDLGSVTTRQVALANVASFDEGARLASSDTGRVAEDLFLYPVEDVSLRRGESAYLPLFKAEMPYRHVYTWRVADALDATSRRRPEVDAEGSPAATVWNTCRLTNPLDIPLTTAAVEFLQKGSFVGQDICYYTAPGAETTIRINQTMNLLAEASEVEFDRQRQASKIYGSTYDLVKVRGELKLRSRLPDAAAVEITKRITGEVLATSPEARVVQVAEGLKRANSTSELVWEMKIQPGESLTASYEYEVYVR